MIYNTAIKEIIDTAIEMVKENPEEEIRYSAIEARLGKQEGYCFMYFDHRADLINECVETIADQMLAEMSSALKASGSVVGRFIDFDKVLKEHIALMVRFQNNEERSLEAASAAGVAGNALYTDLAAALYTFIDDGNAQGVFNVTNAKEKASFIAYGLMGLRSCCSNENQKKSAFYSCMECLLGTDLRMYLKLAA